MRRPSTAAFALLFGCGITHSPGAGARVADGGPNIPDAAGGHWTITFGPAARGAVTEVQLFASGDGSRTDVAVWPAADDPWFEAVSSIAHAGDVVRGAASAHASIDLSVADDLLLTFTATQTDDPMTVAETTIVFQPSTICYGPVTDARSVLFTFTCDGTASASGAVAQESAGSYSGTRACQVGTTDAEGMHLVTASHMSTVMVHVGGDGMACASDVQVRADAGPLSFDRSASESTFTGTVRIHAS